jgi:hypothetical protein
MMMASAKRDVENEFKGLRDLYPKKEEMFCLKCRIKENTRVQTKASTFLLEGV